MAFWAINDELVTEKACTQLLEMKRLGLNGVIFHPRNYSGKPEYLGEEYMRILSDIILHAKSIGMEFWLYDENGFPSGTASGKVLLENPDAKCMWMEYSDGKAVLHEKNAVSTLDEKVCRDFVRITFEGYKRGLSPEAFDYFTGVFSDEVAFLDGVSASVKYGGVPWCEVLEDRYRKKYGESITDRLPLLLEDGEEYETIRENYWQLISEMLRDNFYAPIHKWCQDNHKLYTAHLKGEENIFSIFLMTVLRMKYFRRYRFLRWMHWNGIREIITIRILQAALQSSSMMADACVKQWEEAAGEHPHRTLFDIWSG